MDRKIDAHVMRMPGDEKPHPSGDKDSAAHNARSARAERALGWGLMFGAIAAALLSFAPKSVTRFYTWPWILYWHAVLALPTIGFVIGATARRPAPRLGAALDIGLVLWAVAALLGAWFSPFRWQSMDAALLPLSGGCLAYVMRGWLGFDPIESRARVARAFMVLALVAAAFVLVSWGFWFLSSVIPARGAGAAWTDVWQIRNEHPLGHSIYTAGFVVLTLPLLVGQMLTARGAPRIGWMIVAVAAVMLIPLTSSRGGVLGILGMVVSLGAIALGARGWSRRTKGIFWSAGLGAVLLLVALNPRLRELVAHGQWSAASSESNQQRFAMAQAGWSMGVDRPWLGWGPGTVSLTYPRYRARLSGGVENVLELHSTPVQVWAEHGVIGLLAFAALGVGVLMRAWRLRPGGVASNAGTRDDRVRAWAIVVAFCGYVAFALTDYQLDVPLFVGALATMLALLSALTRPPGLAVVSWSPTFVRAVPAALVLGVLGIILWFARPNLQARAAFVDGAIKLENGDEKGFVEGVQRARALAPWEPFYPNQLAFHLLSRLDTSDDPGRNTTWRDVAITALQQSLAGMLTQEICHTNLGWLFLDSDKPAEAERHFRAAAQLVPDKGGVYFGLGLALLTQQKDAAGVQALALEWINDPRAMTHSLWSRADWQERRLAVMRAASAVLTDLETGDGQSAVQKQAKYLSALIEWWHDPSPANTTRIVALARTTEQLRFFNAVNAAAMPGITPGRDAELWQIVQVAWASSQPMADLARLPEDWAPWRDALARRISQRRDSFAGFLTAPGWAEDGLIRHYRSERLAYGMLARNSDGLRVIDRTPREDNMLVALLPGSIFPAKGWLPCPLMMRLLHAVPQE